MKIVKKNNFDFRKVVVLVLFSCLLLPSLTLAAIFETDLRVGSNNLEVKILQLLLNFDPETRVSASGYGALGRETTYFGEKTRQALINFQRKYRIYGEFGQVGSKTKLKLNTILEKILNPKPQIATTTSNFIANTSDNGNNLNVIATTSQTVVITTLKPVINSISPISGKNNAEITIKGKNFLPTGNIVVTSYTDGVVIESLDGETLNFNFVLPSFMFTSPQGQVEPPYKTEIKLPIGIWVENINGRSNYKQYEISL